MSKEGSGSKEKLSQSKKILLTFDEFFKRECTDVFTALGCRVETEVELFRLPKKLDAVIIMEDSFKVKLNIFHYFKKYNLLSYKSFRDRVTQEDIEDMLIYQLGYIKKESQADRKDTTATLLVSQRPDKFLAENRDLSLVEERVRGHYVIKYVPSQFHIINLEEIELKGLDGIFLSEFVKNKAKIIRPENFEGLTFEGLPVDKKIVDLLTEGIYTRLKCFEGEVMNMGAVADITRYVLPKLEEAKDEGKKEGVKEGLKKGLEKGIKEGLKTGIRKKAEDTARRMKQAGEDPRKVSKYTRLSVEEIEGL